jgi:hypothetical protein
VGGNSKKTIKLIKVGGYILLIDETFIVKLFSTTKKKHECVVQTQLCVHIPSKLESSTVK